MNLIFTKKFKSKFDLNNSPYNGSFIENLTMNKKLNDIRNKIEDMIIRYPIDKRHTLIENIRSFSEIISRSNLSELYTYDILYKNYEKVEVEIPLAIVDNKTPDFWVDQKIAFEVFSTFEAENPFEFAIHEAINSIYTDRKLILGPIVNLSDEEYPKLSEVRNYFGELLNRKSNSEDIEPFRKKFSQGFIISGKLYKGERHHKPIGANIGSVVTNSNYISSVRKRIKNKISKYKGISKTGYPLIIVIHNYNDYLDLEDLKTIFFGDEIHNIDLRTMRGQVTRKNGLIRKEINTSLTCALIRPKSTLDEHYLVTNPYARVELDANTEKIVNSFNVGDKIITFT